MKNKLSLLLILALIISFVFALSSCGETTGTDTNTTVDKESNSETESIEKETATDNKTETETEDSTDTETESVNETETSTESGTETEPEHEHVEEIIPAVKPTCNKVGNTAGKKCAVCDAILEEPVIISTLGHTSAVLPRKEPTCTENGLTEGLKCSICDEILFEQEEIPMLEHEYIANDSKKATCTEFGWNAYITCSFCEYTTFKKVPALGHDMQKASSVVATCITKGYDLYTCANGCGESEQRNEIPAGVTKYHSYKDIVENPTCTETGSSNAFCEYCNAGSGNAKILPALGHTFERTYGEGETDPTIVTTVAPKCEVAGQIIRKCADCDKISVFTYNPLGHTYTKGEYKSPPTCISPAIYFCTICQTDFVAYEEEATGVHDYSIVNVVNATCTDYGYTQYFCSNDENCTAYKNSDFIERKPHKFTDNIEKCDICQESFINASLKVGRVCGSSCTGTGCTIHDIFTITNVGDLMVEEISSNISFEKHLVREKVALIELIGEINTVYEIELFDYEGNIIESFTANIDRTDVEFEINFETSVKANGKKYIDITEVENIVSVIVITASTDAKVSFYCRECNIESLI